MSNPISEKKACGQLLMTNTCWNYRKQWKAKNNEKPNKQTNKQANTIGPPSSNATTFLRRHLLPRYNNIKPTRLINYQNMTSDMKPKHVYHLWFHYVVDTARQRDGTLTSIISLLSYHYSKLYANIPASPFAYCIVPGYVRQYIGDNG